MDLSSTIPVARVAEKPIASELKGSAEADGYSPQLDALRAFAVLGVLVAHNWQPTHLPAFLQSFDWGDIGVRLFFVLSGFLITRILLKCRDLASEGTQSRQSLIGRFYARRFLRIFPVYYLVLAAVIVVNVPPARQTWFWLFSYTSNIYVTVTGNWIGRLSHFWTLAVEEQFYLVWPWLVLLAPRKWLIPIATGMVVLAPVYRFWVAIQFPSDIASGAFTKGTLTIACLDSLGMGALLALLLWASERRPRTYRLLATLALPVGLVLFVALHLWVASGSFSPIYYALQDLALALMFCWLVAAASVGFKGRLGDFLTQRPLVYAGKISYGIYIYHNLVPLLLAVAARRLGLPFQDSGFAFFVISSVIVLGIASLSWEFFEHPINNLKRFVRYAA